MRKHFIFAGKSVAFLCILCVCITFTYQIITPKLCYQEMLPTTLSYINFYEMENDTIDVLFLGSSLAATAYIPQEMYDHYGIRSYNLASEKQSPVVSYYWLKEALRYQSPKVLVMDCNYFFNTNDLILNSPEISIRRALDHMRWSPVKFDAIRTICKLDESQAWASYLFPNIRYHERWAELTESDFTLARLADGYHLKGYAPLAGRCGSGEGYIPYENDDSARETVMPPLMESYLDKIRTLCEQENISLVLTNVPQLNADIGKFHTIQKYAKEHDLAFYDFNEKNLYEASGYYFPEDSSDSSHTNLWGARKITAYLGGILAEQYEIGGETDAQWETTKDSYVNIQKDCELIHITALDKYIEAMNDDRYSIFISAKGSYASGLKSTTIHKLREAGLKVDLQTDTSKENFYYYYAVLSGGQTEEYIGYDPKTYSSSIRNGLTTFDITGDGSIIIDGNEESLQNEGLNIVIYHNGKNRVLDSVCFNTSTEENTVSR